MTTTGRGKGKDNRTGADCDDGDERQMRSAGRRRQWNGRPSGTARTDLVTKAGRTVLYDDDAGCHCRQRRPSGTVQMIHRRLPTAPNEDEICAARARHRHTITDRTNGNAARKDGPISFVGSLRNGGSPISSLLCRDIGLGTNLITFFFRNAEMSKHDGSRAVLSAMAVCIPVRRRRDADERKCHPRPDRLHHYHQKTRKWKKEGKFQTCERIRSESNRYLLAARPDPVRTTIHQRCKSRKDLTFITCTVWSRTRNQSGQLSRISLAASTDVILIPEGPEGVTRLRVYGNALEQTVHATTQSDYRGRLIVAFLKKPEVEGQPTSGLEAVDPRLTTYLITGTLTACGGYAPTYTSTNERYCYCTMKCNRQMECFLLVYNRLRPFKAHAASVRRQIANSDKDSREPAVKKGAVNGKAPSSSQTVRDSIRDDDHKSNRKPSSLWG
uniref:Runt domain-containing protein n=1 Tax=Panagrellus redivivus TaxID=6233 RepID=A0A7E4VA90_PANRE